MRQPLSVIRGNLPLPLFSFRKNYKNIFAEGPLIYPNEAILE